ncbi:MAG: HlyC/CorC family transporter [Burkholderiales bacterium]|nr:HlyC/CorC family transporter [Burkholderiales bacterium]MBS0414040.1 HlyC/CorC family transporter [Pseudomonadota bacterium]
MSFTQSLLLIVLLIVVSAFFSLAEIALAASRRLRLRPLADAGDLRALRVLQVQEQPGDYFTAVQIGVNAVAILGGIVGEGLFGPPLERLLALWLPAGLAGDVAFAVSVLIVTSMFVMFADLLPRRLGMAEPERVAMALIGPMNAVRLALRPLVWLYARCADALLRALGLPLQRDERITPDDILALAEAGTQAGAIDRPEQQVIENLLELETRTVSSAMTPRDRIAWLHHDDPDEVVRARIAAEPYSTYPVCRGELDQAIGYVDAKELFQRVLNGQPIRLTDDSLLHKLVVVPDRLSLSEVLNQFRQQHEDFALIVNEYSTVVGVVTLNDVMSTVMGELVTQEDEEMIVRREDGSWLIDGLTPMSDVLRALDLNEPPHMSEYDTLAGFLMVMLRRVPRRTDRLSWDGHRFEVLDVDNHRIDQVLVTREPPAAATASH